MASGTKTSARFSYNGGELIVVWQRLSLPLPVPSMDRPYYRWKGLWSRLVEWGHEVSDWRSIGSTGLLVRDGDRDGPRAGLGTIPYGRGPTRCVGCLQLIDPRMGGEGAMWGSVWASNGDYFRAADPQIRRMAVIRASGGKTVLPKLRLSFDAFSPMAITTDSQIATGDVRFGSTIAVTNSASTSLDVALAPWVGLPTGMSMASTTYGGFSGGLVLALGADRLRWRSNLAYRTEANARFHAADMGLGFERELARQFWLGTEVRGTGDRVGTHDAIRGPSLWGRSSIRPSAFDIGCGRWLGRRGA